MYARTAPEINQLAMAQAHQQQVAAQMNQQAQIQQQHQQNEQLALQQRQQHVDQQDPMSQVPLTQAENVRLGQLNNARAQAHADPKLGPQDLQQIEQQLMPEINKLQRRKTMTDQSQQQQRQQAVSAQADMLSQLSAQHTKKLRDAGAIGPQDSVIAGMNAHGQLEFKHYAAKTDPAKWHEQQMEARLADQEARHAERNHFMDMREKQMDMQMKLQEHLATMKEKQLDTKNERRGEIEKEYHGQVDKITKLLTVPGKKPGDSATLPEPAEVADHLKKYYPYVWNRMWEIREAEGKKGAGPLAGPGTPPPPPGAPALPQSAADIARGVRQGLGLE